MTPTDSRPASASTQRTPVELPTHGGHHATFRNRVLAAGIPCNGGDPITIQCPKCRATGASADRIGNIIYGWHDGAGTGCGWEDRLTIGRDQHRAVTLT